MPVHLGEKTNKECESFQGKTGFWWILVIAFWNALFGCLLLVSTEVWAYILLACIFTVADVFMAVITMVNYIVVSEEQMLIHFGFSKTYIDLADITSVQETNTPLAGSALSLDRLLITARKGRYIVSVKRKEEFIELLARRNKQIQRL